MARNLAAATLLGAVVLPVYLSFSNRGYWRSVFWCWFLVVACIVFAVYDNVLSEEQDYWRDYTTEMYIRLIGTVATFANIICPVYCGLLYLMNYLFRWRVTGGDEQERAKA